MKSSILCVITLACLTVAGSALACPTGNGEAVRPRPRPVVENVSFQANELFERANRLESSASSQDAQARALEQQAETLSNRARILRNQATFVNVSDRSSILAIADDLSLRAAEGRSRAAENRARADSLRFEAQTLRQRAIALVRGGGNGGGGWRGRSTSVPQSVPVVSDQGITL